MKRLSIWITVIVFILLCSNALTELAMAKDVVRPEEIKSMRQVIYDDETYEKLAGLWKDYYDEYPSEYAYANWMYAARLSPSESKMTCSVLPENQCLLFSDVRCH